MSHTGPNLIFQYKKPEPRLLVTLMTLALAGNLGAAAGADIEPGWLDLEGRPSIIHLSSAIFTDPLAACWPSPATLQLTQAEQRHVVTHLQRVEERYGQKIRSRSTTGNTPTSELVCQVLALPDAAPYPYGKLPIRKTIFADLWRGECLQHRQQFMEQALAVFLPQDRQLTALNCICTYLWCSGSWTPMNSDPDKATIAADIPGSAFWSDYATRTTLLALLSQRGKGTAIDIKKLRDTSVEEGQKTLISDTHRTIYKRKCDAITELLGTGFTTGDYSKLIGEEYASIVTRLRGTATQPAAHTALHEPSLDALLVHIAGKGTPTKAQQPQKSTKKSQHQPSHGHTAASRKSNDTSKKKKDAAPSTNRSVAQTPVEALHTPAVGQAPSDSRIIDAIAGRPSSESQTGAAALRRLHVIQSIATRTATPAASNLDWSDRTEEECNFGDPLEVGAIYAPAE